MPYIGKITDTSGSTGLIGSTLYGTCTTNANTAAKVGTLSDFDTLITGVTIHIKFTNTNTAANPTLNVNSTGAKNIYKAGTTAVGTTVDTSWADGAVVSLTYDGTAWIMNDHADNTDTTYSAGTGLSLSGTTFNVGKRWSAVSQGQKWSRLYYASPVTSTVGTSGILSITATRGSVVYNATFLITSSHAGSNYVHCTELDSCNYTQIKYRTVAKNNGTYYFEIYDTAQSIAEGTTQTWQCCFIPFADTTLTTYTSFTDGTTIPSGYESENEYTTVAYNAASAIRNITRNGNTFTATRQDGSTTTFTQSDTTYSAGTGLSLSGTTFNHSATISTDTTSSESPTHGGTFTVVDSVTRDSTGHVTTLNTKSITLPSDQNTDTKVSQTLSTSNARYPILASVEAVSNTTTTVTTTSIRNNSISINPNNGLIDCYGRYIKNFAIQTGSSKGLHITLETLFTWLKDTKKYIPNNVYSHIVLSTTWAYADNDILQLVVNGTNYELQLAGVIIEFMGTATAYNNGMFRIIIHSPPAMSFTPASGYNKFPVSHIAEYTCNGSTYNPVWKMLLSKGDIFAGDSNGQVKVIDTNFTVYTHPSYTDQSSGLYKITVDATGHVSGVANVEGSDLPSHTHLYAGSSTAGGAATNIATTVTNGGSTYSTYGLVFVENPSTSEGNVARKNNDIRVNILQGSAGTEGYARLILGNGTASSAANNKSGQIALYTAGGGAHVIETSTVNSTITSYLPSTGGTILNTGTTSFTQTLSSGTKIGTIKINGTDTDLYCETNTNTDTKVNVTLNTSTKSYLLATTTTPTSTAQAVESIADTGVYLGTSAGQLIATYFAGKLGNTTPTGGGTITYGSYGLQWANQSTNSEAATNDPTKICNPTADWYHHLILNHANNSGYYVDLAFCFHSNYVAYRRITQGSDKGWVRILDSSNYTTYLTDTKNTAGATDTSSKIYLVGATEQTANPQTYSDNEVYATSGVLTTKKVQVGGGSCTMEYNSTTQTMDFVFA